MSAQEQLKFKFAERARAGPGELVTPLSGPSYGPYDKVKRRWRKPLDAILADAIRHSEALLTRLERGVHCPDVEGKPHYGNCLTEVCLRTREQLAALATFTEIDWSE